MNVNQWRKETIVHRKIGGCQTMPNRTKWSQLWMTNYFRKRQSKIERESFSRSLTTGDENLDTVIYIFPIFFEKIS